MTPDSTFVTLTSDKPAYRVGEPIRMLLTLVNRSDHDLVLEFATGQRYDFLIADGDGDCVWQWGTDRVFTQMLGTERLPRGASQQYESQFVGRLPAGTYTGTGHIVARGASLRASATITIR